ncbi:hypothetical protein HCJ66_11820 [Listeria sp. FSL L7-1582]|uniref:right-handed parallel beta-helix repeat-containing protein n=1 Tax=Listeria portnoyi TaxID=2713504 RepID=UPI00164D1A50|nr:right-handed parallel beta-helix repeat-containing protein [Listeria portnoyi]MBC6310225.1 hypothetical protein [Listeria portnoyi]
MKKRILLLLSFAMVLMGGLLIQGANAKATTLDLKPGTTTAIKAQNTKMLQNAINTSKTPITIPKGNFEVVGSIILKSNVTLIGATTNPADSTITLNGGPMTTETGKGVTTVNNLQLRNFTLQYNANMPKYDFQKHNIYVYQSHLLEIGAVPKVETAANYHAVYKKPTKNNIQVQNMILNANQVGSAALSIAKATNVNIANNQILNSGLQSGITASYTDGLRIDGNTVKNSGRSGISLYQGNGSAKAPVYIRNNKVIDWMERFGGYHYNAAKAAKIAPDMMLDGGIDSYGPANNYVYITGNQVSLQKENNKRIADNQKIEQKWGVKNARYVGYTGIRGSGIAHAVYQNNTVTINSPDAISFMTFNLRLRNTYTAPKYILVEKNKFTAQNISFPIRIFGGASDGSLASGITIRQNTFTINGDIPTYYKTLIDVREKTETIGGKLTYFGTSLVTVTGNKITSKNVKQIVAGTPIRKLPVVDTLYIGQNTLNTKPFQKIGGYLDTVIQLPTYKKGIISGGIMWSFTDTSSKVIQLKDTTGKALTKPIALKKGPLVNFTLKPFYSPKPKVLWITSKVGTKSVTKKAPLYLF